MDDEENEPFLTSGPAAAKQGEEFRVPHSTDDGAFRALRDVAKRSKHPVAALCHLLFKGGAAAVYVFGGLFTQSFALLFIVVVLLLSLDFWTVKNVTGRLLVGLRWWSEDAPGGNTRWVFEARDRRTVDSFDAMVFWAALYGAPLMWAWFCFIALLKWNADWLVLSVAGLSMTGFNAYCFTKCRNDAPDIRAAMSQGIARAAMSTAGQAVIRSVVASQLNTG